MSSASSFFRRRRAWVLILSVLGLIYYFGSPFQLPEAIKDVPNLSRANIAQFARNSTNDPVDEIYGLIHLVTSPEEDRQHILGHTEGFDPTKPVDMSLYAAGAKAMNWNKRAKELDQKYPLVVFSKSYCPFSRRAKELLASYDLSPPPQVIEVDLRDDATQVKSLLTRLTQHSTFPNIIIRGKSIGGSDNLQALAANHSLKQILENAGISVRANV